MKIAFVLPSLAQRGPIIATKNLVEVLIYTYKCTVDIYYFDNIVDLNFGTTQKQINFWEKFRYNEYDIINSVGIRPDAYIFLHKYKVKAICLSFMHSFMQEDLKMQYGRVTSFTFSHLWRLLLLFHTGIITSTNSMKDYYSKFTFNKNIFTIYYGLPQPVLNNDIPEHELNLFKRLKNAGYIIVGSIGLLIMRKGFHQLVKLLKENSKTVVILIGDGNKKSELENLAIKLNVQDRLFILGFKPNYYEYYKYFDIYAITSYSEGFSLALIEALAHQKPILFPDLDIYKEFLCPYYENTFFSLDDICSLSSIINIIYNNQDHFSNQSSAIFNKYFLSSDMGNKFITICQKLIAQNKGN